MVAILRIEVRNTMLRMEGKKIFHNTDQNPKSKYKAKLDSGASIK